MPSVSQIINSLIKNPIVRSNRFIFVCQDNQGASSPSVYSCEQIDVPDLGISTTELQINNMPQTLIPYARNLGDNTFTVTFRETSGDGGLLIYNYYKQWSERVVIPSVNNREYTVQYYDDVVGSAILRIMNLNDTPITTINFLKIYPSSVKINSLDASEENNYIKTTVKFCFEELTTS